jgi:8-oxo-dGTP pyrophosphatase MutT (NUDIX family)
MGICLVIQPFDRGPFDKRYEDVFRPAIEAAGLQPYRIDLAPDVRVPIEDFQEKVRVATVCLAEITTNNPNVWFELGYAIAIRKEVVLVCSDKRRGSYPFDIQHRHIIKYSTESKQDYDRLKEQLTERLKAVGGEDKTVPAAGEGEPDHILPERAVSDALGLAKIYPNYLLAEKDIIEDLRRSSGPVRMFLQIATQNIGDKGSIYDLIQEITAKKSIEFRILHTSEKSPLFARDRLMAMGKDPDKIQASLRYVSRSLSILESQVGISLRHREHHWPFLWRVYVLDKRLYFMPYFSEKDAIKVSPVLVFDKKERSLYNTFLAWFDFVWEACAPKQVKIADLVTPATPAGTAIFCSWRGFHVFGIPRRDVVQDTEYVRFYGIGGKRRDPAEPWEECALREANEETKYAVRQIKSSRVTHFFRANGIIEVINIAGEPKRPRLILEKKKHSGYGSMEKGGDHYFLIAFDAVLSRKPVPTNELAVIIYLQDRHLELMQKRRDVTIAEVLELGAKIEKQPGLELDLGRILIPHGTASFLVRQIPHPF